MLREELEPGAAITPALRLQRRIGGGGMGAVWLAQHLGLDTRVVVKFIAHQIADNAIAAARFRREAAAAAQVRSPHVVQMLDYGMTERGTPYIVMEHLEGKDLSEHLRSKGRLPPHEVVAIVRQVCKALTKAHDLGIIHRDIKPENIFLLESDDDEPFVKLLDFGIAKDADEVSVTSTGAAVGTPHYMSPEQAVGAKSLDHRSDLWSLGVLAFYLLTGRRPFAGETTGALTLAIFNGPIPRPTSILPSLPPAIDDWFLRVCSRDPDGRPPTARALASELADALGPVAKGDRAISDSFKDLPPVIAEPTREYAPPKAANTMERAPTTIKDAGPNAFEVPATDAEPNAREAPARTTSGLSSGMLSTAPRGVPKSRTPLYFGAALLAFAIGTGVFLVARKPTQTDTPTTATSIAPPKSSPLPPIVTTPAFSPSVAPPLATPLAAPVATPEPAPTPNKAAPMTKPLPSKPLPAKSSTSAKPPPVPGDVELK